MDKTILALLVGALLLTIIIAGGTLAYFGCRSLAQRWGQPSFADTCGMATVSVLCATVFNLMIWFVMAVFTGGASLERLDTMEFLLPAMPIATIIALIAWPVSTVRGMHSPFR